MAHDPQPQIARSLTLIQPANRWKLFDLRQIWRHRDLLWILAVRDIKVRYKQTVVGAIWALLQPLLMMVIFASLFHLLGRVPASGDVPYALTLFCALLPWQLFSSAVTQVSDSLVTNQNLVTKVYFPRLILVLAPALACLVDFAIAFALLIALLLIWGITPSAMVLTLPLFVLFALCTALSIGIWLAALNALYRDFRYVLPFLIQIGFFLSPVVFETASLIPPEWHPVYSLNPLVGVIEGFRWALLGHSEPPLVPLMISFAVVCSLLYGGLLYFRRMERTFADWI